MIPIEVTLRNFMCYDENEGDGFRYNFRDHRLWSICGDNGAGKSAIFDAITYTLFGRHRGGERRDEELIRKGANEMACAFSFEHYARLYRVTRTIKRKIRRSGEVAYDRACQLDWYDDAHAAWREVSGCATVTGLEEYVRRDLLGFDYDTFISSVLLLQGESDKLLRSKASDRFSYLSGILDLRRYARLEKEAWSRAKTFRVQSQILAETLQELGIPAAEDVQKANDEAAVLASDAINSAAFLKAAEDRFGRVTLFWDLAQRLEHHELKAKEMADAQAHADEIRSDASEKRLLTEALPRLTGALSSLRAAEVASTDATKSVETAAAIDVDALAEAINDADTRFRSARQEYESKATEIRSARDSQRELEPVLALARKLRDLDTSIDRTTTEVDKIRDEVEPLAGLRMRLERLEVLHRAEPITKSYAEARKRQAQLLAAFGEEIPLNAVAAAATARSGAEEEVERFRLALAESQELIGVLRGELAVAIESLSQREEAGSEGKCSHCGQTVSPDHIRREIASCRREVARLKTASSSADKELDTRKSKLKEYFDRLPALREAEQGLRQQAQSLQAETDRVAELDSDGMKEVPGDIRRSLGGDSEAIDAVLNGVAAELKGLAEVRSQVAILTGKEADIRSQGALIAGWEAERVLVLSQTTPEEVAEALTQAAGFDTYFAEADALATSLLHDVEVITSNQEALRLQHTEASTKKAEALASARVSEAIADGHRANAETAIRGLDAHLLPPTKNGTEEITQRLAMLATADAKLALLETATKELDSLRGQIQEIVGQISNVPEGDRISLEDAAQIVLDARSAYSGAQEEARTARDHAVAIAKQREERLEMEKKSVGLLTQHRIWDRLAKLLGRGGLQLALMKRDLAEIERLTNVILGKISSGMLQLSIECIAGRGGEEIVFRCIDGASAEDALDVAFLSGGQKFRAAVALAAGIGQYAGVGGSMPSQIIDEGFGSLDDKGRSEMLDQIREMSEHFERIIVVSHTDSFHDPALFPARYELRKVGRRTVVEAFV